VSSWGNLNLSDIRRIDFLFNSINKVSATNRNFKNIVNINQAIMIFKGLNHPSIWNSLPFKLKTTDSLLSFKTMAKKHFFE